MSSQVHTCTLSQPPTLQLCSRPAQRREQMSPAAQSPGSPVATCCKPSKAEPFLSCMGVAGSLAERRERVGLRPQQSASAAAPGGGG